MRLYDRADIDRNIDDTYLQRGRGYHRQNRVICAQMSADGGQLLGNVRGSGRNSYTQIIRVRPNGSGMQLHGSCSCPIGHNCKHVAAVLLEGLKEPKSSPVRVANDNGARGSLSLSPQMNAWLEGFKETATDQDPNAYPDDIRQRLVYVLNPDVERRLSGTISGPAKVQLVSVRQLKSGGYGTARSPYDPGRLLNYAIPKYMRPVDLELLRELHWSQATGAQMTGTYDGCRFDGLPDGPRLLQTMLGTGRCHLSSPDGPLLTLSSKRHGSLSWQMLEDGTQKLQVSFDYRDTDGQFARPDLVLPMSPPFYVDVKAGYCGPLDLGMDGDLAQKLVAAPPVGAREAPLVVKALEGRLPSMPGKEKIPLPEAPDNIETRVVKPTLVLRLIRGKLKYDKSNGSSYYFYGNRWEPVEIPLARLMFDYDGREIRTQDKAQAIEHMEDGKLVIMPRDKDVEQQALELLDEMDFQPVHELEFFSKVKKHHDDFYLMPDENEQHAFGNAEEALFADSRFIQLSAEILPWLAEEKGWRIEIADDYPYRIADGDADWYADVEEGSGIDWFSFALGVEFDGQRINLLPTLMQMISALPEMLVDIDDLEERDEVLELLFEDQTAWHTLPDGRLLPLPGKRMLPIIKALLELAGPGRKLTDLKGGMLMLNPMDAGELAGFEELSAEAGIEWQGHERLMELGQKLRNIDKLPEVTPPAHLRDILRPYQKDGLKWLEFLRDTGFGGALADDMGLGKTVQALSFLLNEKIEGRLDKPTLILSPTSVLPNWKAEIQKFAPDLSVLVLHGPDRKQHFGEIDHHDVVLSTYPLLTRDQDTLLEHEYHVAILDEAQAIKNPKSQVSMAAGQLKAGTRIAMTGTPLENNLDEVWSLFRFLNPRFLGDQSSFRRNFRTPIEKHGDIEAQKFLARRLRPFMLRRTKDEVALDLPPKTEIMDYVELEKGQRDLYETIRLMMDDKVREAINKKGLNRSRIIVLDALLKLRQVCCDPRLVKLASAKKVKKSAKLNRLMELLPEMVEEGRGILLFSQFTSMLTLIEAELKKKKIKFVKITGRTKDRETPVKDFQAGKVPLFLISLKAGGSGLNLTAADTVIHYDPWWNPAVENQATDRAHRIGQDKPVFVHKLIVKDGVEEAIQQLKAKKSALAAALFSEKSAGKFELTEDDLAALFAPLDAAAR